MSAIESLLAGLIDYAGLFPPAALDIRSAASNYADYLRGPDRARLGRLVVPVARLGELDEAAGDLLPRDGSAWRVSAIAGEDFAADMARVLRFNCEHWQGSPQGHVIMDTIETRLAEPGSASAHRAAAPEFYTIYGELPPDADPLAWLPALKESGVRAKLRTGGTTAAAFPPAEGIVAFLAECARLDLPFKLTAGLHHPLCGEFALTYEAGSARAPMFGYLNVFLAAAALRAGHSRDVARDVLLESRPEKIHVTPGAVSVAGITLTAARIADARTLATSFGSCSFTEPMDELRAIGYLND